jgi:hypothetical protein
VKRNQERPLLIGPAPGQGLRCAALFVVFLNKLGQQLQQVSMPIIVKFPAVNR